MPTPAVREAVGRLASTWAELHDLEARHGLDVTRRPDAGIVDATYRWAGGANLLEVLTHADITAGDFVRWMRQVIDLLGQIAQAVESGSALRDSARAAGDLVSRGVVSYSSTV
jgi:ATP-dependent RNA helicase HelY